MRRFVGRRVVRALASLLGVLTIVFFIVRINGSPAVLLLGPDASPEAAVGGGLALLRTGDRVRIDLRSRRADILISDDEYAARKAAWRPPELENQTPWQQLFRAHVGQLESGACLDFAVNFQRIAETRGLPRDNH